MLESAVAVLRRDLKFGVVLSFGVSFLKGHYPVAGKSASHRHYHFRFLFFCGFVFNLFPRILHIPLHIVLSGRH